MLSIYSVALNHDEMKEDPKRIRKTLPFINKYNQERTYQKNLQNNVLV